MMLFFATLLAALAGAAQWDMTTVDEVQVIGIEARTSNAKEMTAEGVIGNLWARLNREGLLTRIPNKADSAVVALYTDYESDKEGAYTFVLGARVSSTESVPEGMVARKIPPGRYAVFTSERGPAQNVVFETWKRIWTAPLDRAYKTDFEIYDERAADQGNMQMSIYVGVR
jgi:predicted transcriptional regulator YdeE